MDLHEKREMNKFSLATFGFDVYNRLDYAADQTIKQLKDDNEKTAEDYRNWEKMKGENPTKWKELGERADRMDLNLDAQLNNYMMDIIYRTEEMVAMMEMKIIYAYKHLEINIKKLITAAYPGTSAKDFYKWELLLAFLKTKSIKPETINGYKEVNELRHVNNAAKHKDNIHEDLQHIEEFKGQNYISFESLEKFYDRIKKAPESFLQSLSNCIYKEIYEFDEKKMKTLAESIVLRMDEDQSKQLINAIETCYK